MSFLGKLFGAPAAELVGAVGSVVDDIFTSDEEREQARAVLERLRQEPDKVQAAINQVEAAHPSVFVAGWRPAIGWVCALSLFAYYPPRFIAATWLWVSQIIATGEWVPPPEVGVTDILGLVGSMLGMSYLRTNEKKSGVARAA